MNYAPILVSVYNREWHFRQCIESLSRCRGASESHVYIAIDAPFQDADKTANQKIIEYSKSIKGFKQVSLLIRDTNLGTKGNRDLARKEIFQKYDRLIMFEDDNTFSEDFLEFVNNGLDTYEKNPSIFSVSGYQFPIETPNNYEPDLYAWIGFSAWGVGIWKEKWYRLNWESNTALSEIREFLHEYKNLLKFNDIANNYIPALIRMLEKKTLHADGYISLWQFLNNMYSVFPVTSRVRNIGNDGSGQNCGDLEDDIYSKQRLSNNIEKVIFPDELKPNSEIDRILYKHFERHILSKIKSLIKVLAINSGIYAGE